MGINYQTFFYNIKPNWASDLLSIHNEVDASNCNGTDAAKQLKAKSFLDKNQNIFTAQFKGVYFFTYSASVSSIGNPNLSAVIELLKNEEVVSAGVMNAGTNVIANYPIQIKATLILQPGDQVTIKNYTRAADGSITNGILPMDDFAPPDYSPTYWNYRLPQHLDFSHGTFNGFQLISLP